MPIRFRCSRCNHGVKAAEDAVGRKMYCPTCFYELIVPAESTVASRNEGEPDVYGVDAIPIDVREMRHRDVASFPCPVCQALLAATPDMIGREIECPDCGTKAVVPAEIATGSPTPVSGSVPWRKGSPTTMPGAAPVGIYGVTGRDALASGAQQAVDPFGNPLTAADAAHASGASVEVFSSVPSFPVWCRLCGTILYATDAQIGTMLTCPDCETQTIARKMEQVFDTGPHQTQRFEGGSTYELADDAPPPGTRLVPVVCSLCATRMYAPESEIGGTKICPDCGRSNPILDVPEKEKFVYEVPGGEYGISDESQTYKPPPVRAGVDYRLVDGSLDRESWKAKREQATAGSLGFARPSGNEPDAKTTDSGGRSMQERPDGSAHSGSTRSGSDPTARIGWGATPRVPEEYDRRTREAEIAAEAKNESISKESKREKNRKKNPIPRYENVIAPLVARRDAQDVPQGQAPPAATPTGEEPARPIPVPPPLPTSMPVLPPTPSGPHAPSQQSRPEEPAVPKKRKKRERNLSEKDRKRLRQGKRLLPRFPLVNGLLRPFLSPKILGQLSGLVSIALVSGLLWAGALFFLEKSASVHFSFRIPFYLLMGLQAVCYSVLFGILAEQCITLFTASAGGGDEWVESGEYEYSTGVMLAFCLLVLNVAATVPAAPFIPAMGSLLLPTLTPEAPSPVAPNFALQYALLRLSHWLFFPPIFLGAMETGSFFNPFSGRVWGSVFTSPLRWTRFYAVSFFILVLPEFCVLPLFFVHMTPLLYGIVAVALSVLFTLIALLYFRLLGRHAWTLT